MTDLGTARGRVVIDPSGAVTGFGTSARAAQSYDAQMKKTSANALAAGRLIGGTGLLIGAGLVVAINSAANFEERMSAVQAVSGASAREMEQLRQKALQLGADTKFSAGEAALALEELVKAGVPLADVLDGAADAAVNLAAAGEIDLAEAASIASAALNTFGLRGRDMAHVADLIAGSANVSAIDVHEFGESLKQSGAAAALVGLSFDDLALGITAMGNAGIKGSDAGTSLKTMLLNLQPTTNKQKELMKELGLVTEEAGNRFFTQEGKVKSLTEIAGVLNEALAGMTDAQKTMALETLFGTDAIRAAAVISREGAGGLTELSDAMTKISAEDVAEQRMDNLKGSLEQLQGSLETLLIIIGTPFLKGLRSVADVATTIANKFAELSPRTQELIGRIAAVAAVVLLAIGALSTIVGWITAVATGAGALGGAIAFLVSPIGLIIVAVVALAAGLIYLWKTNEGFRNAMQKAWDYIISTVIPAARDFISRVVEIGRAVVKWFQDTAVPALQRFADFITGTVVPAIVRFAGEVEERIAAVVGWLQRNVFPIIELLGELFVAVADKVVLAFGIMEPIVTALFENIVTIIQAALDIIVNVVGVFVDVVVRFWQLFGDNILDTVQVAFNFVKSFIQGALTVIRGIITTVIAIITGDWGRAWEGIRLIASGAWQLIRSVIELGINAIGLIIRNAIDTIRFAWDVGWKAIGLIISTAWTLIQTVVTLGINAVRGVIGATLNLIRAVWNSIWGQISGVVTAIWNGMVSFVTTRINLLRSTINTILSGIRTLWNNGWNNVSTFLSSAWSRMTSTVSSALNSIVTFLRGLPGRALSALAGIAGTLVSRGKELITGFMNGIRAGVSTVITYLGNLPSRVLEWIGDMGSVLVQAGKDLIGGFISGIKSAAGGVADALGNITNSLTSWKGPPQKDRKILVGSGELVMEGFMTGILNQVAPLRDLLQGIVPAMGADLRANAAADPTLAGAGAGFNSSVSLTFQFPNVTSARDVEQIEEALSHSEVLERILHATRAGVGRR